MTEQEYMQQLNIWMIDLIEKEDKSCQAAVNTVLIKELFKLKKEIEEIKNER